jgi:hypothetical protein
MVGAFENRCRTTYQARIATAQRAAAAAASEAVAHLAGADSSQPIILTATAVPAQAAAPSNSRASAARQTVGTVRLERAVPLSAASVVTGVPAASPTVTMVLAAANPHMDDTAGTGGLQPNVSADAASQQASGQTFARQVASTARVDTPKPAPASPHDRPFPSTRISSPVSTSFSRLRTPGSTIDAPVVQQPAAPQQQQPKPAAPMSPAGQPLRTSTPAAKPPAARAGAISTPVPVSSGARSFAQSAQSVGWPLRFPRQQHTPRPAPPLPRGLSLW